MALRGDLIRRVTTFLHGYNNISPAHSISLDAPPWGEGIFKFLESNKQTHFRRVFFGRQQKGERSGKLVTTLETSKSRWRPPGKNRQESGETGFSETAVPQRRRERRWPSSLLENSVRGVPLPLSGEGKRPEGGRERGWLTRRGQPL